MTAASNSTQDRRRRAIRRVAAAANAYGIAVDAMNDAAAKVLDVNRTDMRLIALLREHEQLSPGRLARTSGLSPATTTTAIGRLIKAGYADQQPDPDDGRRSTVTLTAIARRALADIYGPVLTAGTANLQNSTVAELDAVEGFLRMAEGLQRNASLSLLANLGNALGDAE